MNDHFDELAEALTTGADFLPIKPEGIQAAFTQKLKQYAVSGIYCDDVFVDLDGDITVVFSDDEGQEMALTFMVEDGGAEIVALLYADDMEDGEVIEIDLTPLAPAVGSDQSIGQYVLLTELSWLNKSALLSMLLAGELLPGRAATLAQGRMADPDQAEPSPFGEGVDEASVLRGTHKVRLPVVRERTRSRLSEKGKAVLRKHLARRRENMAGPRRVRSLRPKNEGGSHYSVGRKKKK